MADFSFGGINVKSRKQVLNLKTYESPLLVDKSGNKAMYNIPLVFLVEEHFGEKELGYIQRFLGSLGCTRYLILHSISCDYSDGDAAEGIIKFYKNNKSNFWDYIPQNASIITSGPALYSLLQEDDIYPNHVEQIIFGKSSFWFSPDLTTKNCHRIYPIASLKEDIFGYAGYKKWCSGAVDSYKTKLAEIQISNAIKYNSQLPPRYPNLNKVFIHDIEEFNTLFYDPNKNKKDEVMAWDLETSGLNFMRDKIGCITISFDGITGYYIPWDILDYDCKVKLNNIMKNNKNLGCNLKFDLKFVWKPRDTKKIIYGYKVIENNGIKYKINNNQKINTQRGFIYGSELLESDTIKDFSSLEVLKLFI